jgi:hypothetical protein
MPSVARLFHQRLHVIGDAYYWAINRMMDATVGAEYFSLRGGSQRGEFRVRPSETSYVDLNYFGVIDRGIGSPPLKEGGENARLNCCRKPRRLPGRRQHRLLEFIFSSGWPSTKFSARQSIPK